MTDTPDPTPSEPGASRFFLGQRAGVAALAVSLIALAVTVAPYLTGGSFDGRVRNYLLQHPELLQEMSDGLQTKQDQQRGAAIQQRADANPALLRADARDPAFGPADAKVTVVEFFDFRCPGCKATAPEVLRLMQAHPDVRFVFKDWPILDQGSDGVSHHAARAALAAHRQGKYLPVFRDLMAQPSLDEASIEAILAANGVSMARAQTEIASPDIARHLADIDTAGRALQLVGTPTFFVAGKAQASIQPADLDRAIRSAKS
ncbi:MAG: disulfide bond formation protein DsbA [Brevundimonas sp.]|nr:MAG: disulfide bond formation protein DsbA [Brevundimonas sp.]